MSKNAGLAIVVHLALLVPSVAAGDKQPNYSGSQSAS